MSPALSGYRVSRRGWPPFLKNLPGVRAWKKIELSLRPTSCCDESLGMQTWRPIAQVREWRSLYFRRQSQIRKINTGVVVFPFSGKFGAPLAHPVFSQLQQVSHSVNGESRTSFEGDGHV